MFGVWGQWWASSCRGSKYYTAKKTLQSEFMKSICDLEWQALRARDEAVPAPAAPCARPVCCGRHTVARAACFVAPIQQVLCRGTALDGPWTGRARTRPGADSHSLEVSCAVTNSAGMADRIPAGPQKDYTSSAPRLRISSRKAASLAMLSSCSAVNAFPAAFFSFAASIFAKRFRKLLQTRV